jgi:Fe-S-cluster containining protein
VALPIILPERARFTCQSCGECCRGWAVPVDEATAAQLREHDWGTDPFEKRETAGYPYRIRLVDERCFFLDDQNRCRIHTELSYEAKPAACRAFPLTVLEVGARHYGRLSFWCPTVVANTGKPLDHQLRWVSDTAKKIEQRATPLTIDGTVPLTVRAFDRVHGVVRRLVSDQSLSAGARLTAASAVIRRLERAQPTSDQAVDDVLRAVQGIDAATLAAEGRQGGRPAAARRLLSRDLFYDTRGGRLAALRRVLALALFNAGLARLSSRATGARASWREIQGVTFTISPESDQLVFRYLVSKIESRRYAAGDATLVSGFNLVVAAYGIVNVLARMRAAAAGRTVCKDEDVQAAVRAADLLVIEHRGSDTGRQQAALRQAALGGSTVAADLIDYLEQ